MSQIMVYFLHSISVLSFYIDVYIYIDVLTLSTISSLLLLLLVSLVFSIRHHYHDSHYY